MLNIAQPPKRGRQQGMVLVMALIVLVLVSLSGLALMRSVDTTTLVAGNLAFQQAATRASDTGVERAIANVLTPKAVADLLNANDTSNGYFATLANPSPTQTWQAFWQASLDANSVDMGEDQFGNQVKFVIHRLCANALPPSAGGQCVASPNASAATGNSEEANAIQLQGGSNKVYYRITVRVSGPRRTESYVQAHVSM